MKKKILMITAGLCLLCVIIFTAIIVKNTSEARQYTEQMELGEKYLAELEYESAVAAYMAAIEIEPKSAEAYIGLAEAYLGMGETDKAIEILEEGIRQTDSEELKSMLDKIQQELVEAERKKIEEEKAKLEKETEPETTTEEETTSEPETTTVEETTSLAQATEEKKIETLGRIVNIEEVDITHDGVLDKIVTYIMGNESAYSEGKTLEELVEESHTCTIRVYDGNDVQGQDMYALQDCIWERGCMISHVGNGQYYLLERNGKAYLLSNSDYAIQGWVSFSYRVFYLNEKGEEIIEQEADLHFIIDSSFPMSGPDYDFSAEESITYTEALDELLRDSKLLAYYNVDKVPRASTFEKGYSGNAIEIWDLAERDVNQEITMDNLREMLEAYEDIMRGR